MPYRSEEELDVFLRRTGAYVWFPRLCAAGYRKLCIGCGILAGGAGSILFAVGNVPVIWSGLLGILGFVCGCCLPPLLLWISDKRDNEQMLPDIRKLFEFVKIQMKAGMYLTNTLSACYLAIANRRLKQGLMELNAQLVAWNDVKRAVNVFESKFQNLYISQFCMIVRQSEESGRMTEMLEDMSRQILDMEKQILKKYRGQMERRVLCLTLLMFIGILAIAVYQLAASFFTSITGMMA